MYKLFFDAGVNKSVITIGFIIYKDNIIVSDGSYKYKDPSLSNNVGEFISLIVGLTEAIKFGIKDLKVYGDSKCVIQHMNGEYKAKAKTIKSCHATANFLIQQFNNIEFNWISRKDNKDADRRTR